MDHTGNTPWCQTGARVGIPLIFGIVKHLYFSIKSPDTRATVVRLKRFPPLFNAEALRVRSYVLTCARLTDLIFPGKKIMKKDKDRTPVAKDLVTLCTRCGLELSHVVVVHNLQGIVERVKCKTCGSEHKYHPEKKTPPPKTPRPKKPAIPKRKDPAKEFQKLSEKFKEKKSIAYSISGLFQPDDVIDHKTFGTGIVTSVSYQKMEVAFSEGRRILACNR